MLSGDNSILSKATDAKTKSDEAQIRERIQLAYHSALTKDITGENSELTMTTLQAELNNEFAGKTVTITPSVDKKEWTIKVDEVEITVIAGKNEKQKQMTIAEAKSSGKVFDGTEEPLVDNYGNEIIVPKGFKIIEGTNVTDGIVIQDESAKDNISKGNQFVWIPVGDVYTTADEEKTSENTKKIQLDRYAFEDAQNNKTGIPTSWSKLVENGAYHAYIAPQYTEETTTRINVAGKNATAKELNVFLEKATKGFYIGRYEARVENGTLNTTGYNKGTSPSENWTGYIGGTLVEKKNVQVYNYVTQNKAAELSRAMYSNLQDFESDLINSYAWDTATVFFQEFGEEKYSVKTSVNNSFENMGTTNDVVCNVYDMASNCYEFTTESSNAQCVYRSGYYGSGDSYMSCRIVANTTFSSEDHSFRTILYVK